MVLNYVNFFYDLIVSYRLINLNYIWYNDRYWSKILSILLLAPIIYGTIKIIEICECNNICFIENIF